jgi:uncharacterized protein YeaO (DUF488 family)
MTALTDWAVQELEARWKQEHAKGQELDKQVRAALRDLGEFCRKIAETQKANDHSLQDLHRELGQIEAAANQQRLTALLTAPDDGSATGEDPKTGAETPKRSGGQVLALVPDNELRAAVERARARGNRFNAARIDIWIKELDEAIRLGVHAMIDRGLAGLEAELTE